LKEGRLSFIALHSAHWSKPFIAAMGVRAVDDALQSVPAAERARVKVVQVPDKGGLTGPKERISPWFDRYKTADGTDTLEVHLPRCVFSKVEAKALPSQIYTWLPKHPIAEGIPGSFEIPHTEIYGGEFSVPKPDAMIFEERWADGSRFTSGCAWQVEKGRVFYFRPGHETYAVFTQEYPLKIVANAVRWARP
jgi:trehalose utilization protein